MVKQADFTTEEWQLIADGPEWVFAALAAADGNVALMIKYKESSAFDKVVKEYRSRSALVSEVLGSKAKTSKDIKTATLSDAEQALQKISHILDAKVPRAEAADYRALLTEITNSVADATGEGMLGLGQKLSTKEAAAIVKIKSAIKPGKKVAAPVTKKPATAARKPMMKTTPTKRPGVTGGARPSSRYSDGAFKKPAKVIAVHKVKPNETWTHLSLKYYGHTTEPYWRLIYEFNKELIGDDYKDFYEGLEIKIPELPPHLKDKG